jgi:transposase
MSAPQLFGGLMAPKPNGVWPSGPRAHAGQVAKDATGRAILGTRLQRMPLTLNGREAPGGGQRGACGALAAAGLPVAVITPRQVRDCAQATGQLISVSV